MDKNAKDERKKKKNKERKDGNESQGETCRYHIPGKIPTPSPKFKPIDGP
jgi:hypothetical protein